MSNLEIAGFIAVFFVVVGAVIFRPKAAARAKVIDQPKVGAEEPKAAEEDEEEDPFGDKDPPRQWHYDLGHVVLARGLFKQPELFRTNLRNPNTGYGLIEQAVNRIAEAHNLPDQERDDILKSMTIFHHEQHCADGMVDIYIVTMPEATKWAECSLFAIAFTADGTPYYYTLELGSRIWNTVLGSWDAKHNHLNHGDGPMAVEFAKTVGEHICKRRARGRAAR